MIFISYPSVADLYIPGLLQGFLGSKRWMMEIKKQGRTTSTDTKATVARQNGKLGGGGSTADDLVELAHPECDLAKMLSIQLNRPRFHGGCLV